MKSFLELERDIVKVTVLMSTYNGEKYLRQQIESILNQEGVDVELIVRDDCSADKTLEVLKEYQKTHNNIKIIEGTQNLGACRSFFQLIGSYDTSDYYALSDQDDIWDTDKLKIAVGFLEKRNPEIPLLYYSNLRIVDANGHFCRISHSKPHIGKSKYSALSENLATGCTIVYNKTLAGLACQVKPKKFYMHDAWLYLVAKMFGETIYDFNPHINYRQHGDNEIGTYKKGIDRKKIREQVGLVKGNNGRIWSTDAKIFLRQFSGSLTKTDKDKIIKFESYNKSLHNKINVIKDRCYYADDKYRILKFITEVLLGTL